MSPRTLTDADKAALREERKADEAAIAKEAQRSQPAASPTLRLERNVDVLVKIIARVKRQVSVPVTTGETWDIWLGQRRAPEDDLQGRRAGAAEQKRIDIAYQLASSVDFIAAHILPYWDRTTAPQAVEHTLSVYNKLRKMHEGKRIVIAEFGWPSGGYNRAGVRARPHGTGDHHARVRRRAPKRLGIDYNVIEAFDQPWKTFEGSVGSYWGLFDASRTAKFSWTGPIVNPDHGKLAAIAVATGLLVSLPILAIAGATLAQVLLLAFASHIVGAWAATVFDFWNGHYFVWGAAFAFFLGVDPAGSAGRDRAVAHQEIAAILFGRGPRRLLTQSAAAPRRLRAESLDPYSGLHGSAGDAEGDARFRQPPRPIRISNASSSSTTRPIRPTGGRSKNTAATLGERFKFINVERLEGFKAGALRLALAHTAPDAEIIGVIDADYVVHPNWLQRSRAGVRRSPRSVSSRRRRITATAAAARCITP